MPHISLTRLRLRSLRFLPLFASHALRSNRQVQRAPGFLHGSLLPDRHRIFWTLTAWDSEQSMRAYMISGAHKSAMLHLLPMVRRGLRRPPDPTTSIDQIHFPGMQLRRDIAHRALGNSERPCPPDCRRSVRPARFHY